VQAGSNQASRASARATARQMVERVTEKSSSSSLMVRPPARHSSTASRKPCWSSCGAAASTPPSTSPSCSKSRARRSTAPSNALGHQRTSRSHCPRPARLTAPHNAMRTAPLTAEGLRPRTGQRRLCRRQRLPASRYDRYRHVAGSSAGSAATSGGPGRVGTCRVSLMMRRVVTMHLRPDLRFLNVPNDAVTPRRSLRQAKRSPGWTILVASPGPGESSVPSPNRGLGRFVRDRARGST